VSIRSRRAVRAISGALLALMLVVPGTVSAATPDLIDTWTVIPTAVNNGDYVALRASIYNNDSSTVSQLYLVELTRPEGFTLDSIKVNLGGKGAACDTTGDAFTGAIKCTLGQLKPDKTATVTAVFKTSLTGTTATPTWEFNTTGIGSATGGDQSHGDSWPSLTDLTVALRPAGDVFGGRYVLNDALKIVENNQALSSSNPHSTRAYAPVTGIGVTVEDIVCNGAPDDDLCADLSAGFGEISKVNVNDDADSNGITATTLLHFYIQLDSSEIPAGANANSVSVLHVYPGGSEELSTRCTFARKATIPNNAPCITVKTLPGGDLGIDVWTFHNGGLRVQA
jgi:hypothetical protein